MSFLRGYWVLVLGVVFLVLGVISDAPFVEATTPFGWTAYAPLTSTTFTPGFAPYGPVVLLALGLILVSGWVGHRLGRRKQSAPQPPPDHP